MGTGPAQTESSDRKARERKKANQIRTNYQAKQTKKPITPDPRSDRQQMADTTSAGLTKGQRAAGARAAGMAQNLSSIAELEDRRSDARNPVSKYNLTKQIEALGRGGVPVTTKKSGGGASKYGGETLTVGVVSGGRYLGRRAYDPARGGTGKTSTEGFYTVKNKVALADAMTSNAGVDPNDPNRLANRQRNSSKAAADAASKNIVTIRGDGLTASQRAAASGAGAAARRKFLGNVR
nr:hypothetical protein [uncultured Mediterranean phage uvMED]BAR17115.1 hypothetical protein [uncultured Mediterranean phage uvMED]